MTSLVPSWSSSIPESCKQMTYVCQLPECRNTTDDVSQYCSDECLQADMAPDYLPPTTVLSKNKSGGFGRDLCWQERQYVYLPKL